VISLHASTRGCKRSALDNAGVERIFCASARFRLVVGFVVVVGFVTRRTEDAK